MSMEQDKIIFGAAYYEELLPYDRLERDMELMAGAGINTIRIGESAWSTIEPRLGEYDFSRLDRVITAAAHRGISVIVCTPAGAVPPWLVRLDPGVLAAGESAGHRQVTDVANPTYLHYAEGVIRALVRHTVGRGNVIGFQVGSETLYGVAAGPHILARFRRWMAERFGTVETMNEALGLAGSGGPVASFEDLPDPAGSKNGCYACEFDRFRRELGTAFLRWQADIVSDYVRPGQFITHGFAGLAPAPSALPGMDRYDAARALTVVGADVYCPAQDRLTGAEIAFAGGGMRPLGKGAYLVLETQAQGVPAMTPYPGQLRLMAYSHLAAGAAGLMYWHWSSAHNGPDSWFRGVLGHDFTPGPAYDEIKKIGAELSELAPHLTGYSQKNRAAVIVSPEARTAMGQFPADSGPAYDDVVRWLYRALYELNIGCDVLSDREEDWSGYDLLLFPALYTADYPLIQRVRDFVKAGGTVFATFRSFAADGYGKLYHDEQPHLLTDLFGVRHSQAVRPEGVTVDGAPAEQWMELLEVQGAEAAANYEHKHWGAYAAVTCHSFGAGRAWYMGTMVPCETLKTYLLRAAADAGLDVPAARFPVVVRKGANGRGKTVRFLLNYADGETAAVNEAAGTDLLTGEAYGAGQTVLLPAWGVRIIEE